MPRPTVALLLLVAALAPAPANAATETVRSGSMTATIASDPFRITYSGRGVTLTDRGLGVRTTVGTDRAGSATLRREGDAVVADVAAGSRRLVVRVAPASEGAVAVTADLLGSRDGTRGLTAAFGAVAGERYLGLGERATAVDHRGRDVEGYVADGPYDDQPGERVVLAGVVPPAGFRNRDDATYYPVPWLLSTRGYGVLVDSPETTYHRLAGADEWSVELTTAPDGSATPQAAPGRLALRVFAGPRPADVLRRFTAATGRQPDVRAPWVWGAWFQPGGSTAAQRGQIEAQRKADVPVSVAQTYLHYLPCGDQQGIRPQERERTAALHAAGTATTTYFNPMVCERYGAAFARGEQLGALLRRADGSTYTYPYASSPSPEDRFDVGQVDFTVPAGRQFYAELLGEAVEDGHDGWMEDFGEYTPLDSVGGDGTPGTAGHNLHPVQYHCAAYDVTRVQERPIVRFQRSGHTGSAACAQVVWSGDPTTDWGFDGLASQVKAGLGIGLSGVSRWGSDIGGFFALGTNRLEPELLRRWVQFGAVSPVMRNQRGGVSFPPQSDRPMPDAPGQIANWRRWTKFHTQLYPYLVAADADYRANGIPIMRHHALTYPGDAQALAQEDEYLFGPDLLAAPVLEEGARERRAYLPEGRWVDLWRSAAYDAAGAGGVSLRGATVLTGGREVTVPAPEDELPLFVRAGAILPLLPPEVDTLAPYGYEDPDVVHLEDRRGRRVLLAFPRGRSRARMHEDERIVSLEGRRGWSLTIRGERVRRYALQATLRTLERPFRPRCVLVGGRRLARSKWSYDAATGVLRAELRGKRTTLRAQRSSRCR